MLEQQLLPDYYPELLVTTFSFLISWVKLSFYYVTFALHVHQSSYPYVLWGLDPAANDFPLESIDTRLDTSDAAFVDVIHTSSVAFIDPTGHVDFYPNGGVLQTGCPVPDTSSFRLKMQVVEFSKKSLASSL